MYTQNNVKRIKKKLNILLLVMDINKEETYFHNYIKIMLTT